MNSEIPILSICIPTYNRAELLQKSLESLVCQDIFKNSDQVEIVISDNCSTDKTSQVANEYVQRYGAKIKYFRNEENVFDKNFALSLQKGSGKFLKLCNDTLVFQPNSLAKMVDFIKAHEKEKCVLFFPNNHKKLELERYDFDGFVKRVSFLSTWIGGMGLWQEDKTYLSLMSEYADTKLSQTYVLFKMIEDKKIAAVFNQSFCTLARPSIAGNYNIFEVFLKNYLQAYQPYLEKKVVSKKVFNREKWRLLSKYILPRALKVGENYQYDITGFWKYTKPYHYSLKFYILLMLVFCKKILKSKR